MIVNYSVAQAIKSCHHARKIDLTSVLLWRSFDQDKRPVLLVIPFHDDLHYGIFYHNDIRRIDL